MSKVGAMYLEMTEDAQSMTRDEFVAKWGMLYVQDWHRMRDPDYYDSYEPELEYD